MSEAEDKMGRIEVLLRILDRYGLATLGLIGMTLFAYYAIEYERTTMMPTIELNTKAIERNSEVIRQLPAELRKERKTEEKQP